MLLGTRWSKKLLRLMIISNKKLQVEFFKQPNYITKTSNKLEKIIKDFSSFFSINEINLEISFCSAQEIKKINKQFRGQDKPTNVLSFPDENLTNISIICNGEILICNDILLAEAKDQNKEIFNHFVHLLVHSMLHIVGYGHEQENDAILMENNEVKFLSKIGISDPYK